ncbi:OmpA family protein [Fulvivirgaceae bacterium PWU20]|uniref:OmpA family protein n=2 Tax=Chryseosolibacter indicus TaxID=2782351 RepID=A0ABS5W1J5_9BACT|nr:OmpA family protein [Chryseosolibacter indicus]
MQSNGIVSLILAFCLVLASCQNMNKAQKGTYIGAAGGAAAGAAIGKAAGNTAMGAILGAAVGGAAGYGIGRYMDKQAEELKKDLEGAEITRVGEGIKITFREGIQFALNSAELSETSKTNLKDLAETLKKYDDTNVLIEGHTDVTGTREHNMTLSEKRAESVSSYLETLGVAKKRLTTEGYGPDQPVADNNSDYGRQQNRRVEVAIFANDKLKKKAEKGELGEVSASEGTGQNQN